MYSASAAGFIVSHQIDQSVVETAMLDGSNA